MSTVVRYVSVLTSRAVSDANNMFGNG